MTVPTAPTALLSLDVFKSQPYSLLHLLTSIHGELFPSVYCEFISGNILSMGIMWKDFDGNNKSHSELYLQCSMRGSFLGSFLGSAGEDAERTSS